MITSGMGFYLQVPDDPRKNFLNPGLITNVDGDMHSAEVKISPELLQPGDPLMASSYVVPDEDLADVVPAREVEDHPPAAEDPVADVAASEPQDSDPAAATD